MKSKGRLGESNVEDLPKVHLRAMPHGRMPAPPAWQFCDWEEGEGTGEVTSAFPQRDLLLLITP
jgi:hypothetical protein